MTFSKLLPLYVVIFFGFMGYSMMLTLFTPLFMYAQHGLVPPGSTLNDRIIILGVVLSLFPLAQFFSAPILGTFSDRYGRKPILILSLAIAPLCYALMAIALTIESLALLMLSSFIAGISQGNIAIAQSAIADIAPRSDRTRYFGYIYLSASTSYVAGPLLGGKLSDPTLVSEFSYATPFWIVFALLVLTFFGRYGPSKRQNWSSKRTSATKKPSLPFSRSSPRGNCGSITGSTSCSISQSSASSGATRCTLSALSK